MNLVSLPHFPDVNGLLVVVAESPTPFEVRRVFTIHAMEGALRGEHAHRECQQFLVATSGSFLVRTQAGEAHDEVVLDSPAVGLLVPPLVWASELALEDDSVLLVLCDRSFDESDYIRDYGEFCQIIARKQP